ncbi:MAG TPA: FG-GAP repeat protein [Blastocatellia bacterium]|nr:FG-GAP repeat protein [Blastocatellia bacterium]
MKRKINRVVSKIALAIIIASLSVTLPMPRLNARFSSAAQTVIRFSNAQTSLRGEAAILSLKERGLYDSLQDAVIATRYEAHWDEQPMKGSLRPSYHALNPSQQYIEHGQLIVRDGEANDHFGSSVAIYGNTAVVGMPDDDIGANSNQGSAYIFVHGGGTSWYRVQKLTASDGAANDHFGSSVAIYWDFAVVGAPNADIGSRFDQGSAYVFARGGGFWREHQKLTASDGAVGDMFGASVAMHGITTVVGAPYDDVFGSAGQGYTFNQEQGSAYVFVSYYGDWVQEHRLDASDGAAYDHFGFSVAVHGDTFAVGAPQDNDGPNRYQGSAYVFERAGASWIELPKLTASDGAAYDSFGYSVAIDTSAYRDTLVVGAPFSDNGANLNQGSAYVFERSSAGWSEQPKLTAGDGATADWFGYSVAINKYIDTVVVGAPLDNDDPNFDQGSAYIFARSGGNWIEQQRLTASDRASGDGFGYSVAIGLLTDINQVEVMVGAPTDDIRAMNNRGSAYNFSASIIGNF